VQFYKARGIRVLGIEPAANIADLAIKKGISTLVEFFDEGLARRLAARGEFAEVIHAHNVFAHVPDPNNILSGKALKQFLPSVKGFNSIPIGFSSSHLLFW
jgi:hypothetical protein